MAASSTDDASAANGHDSGGSATADVIIVGASARSAAFSAIRAGLRPICFDQFADIDLRAVAPVVRVDEYPNGLMAALEQYPPLPVIYTGAMENHPQVLSAIAARQPLLGNNSDIVHAVRDPLQVHEVLTGVNMPCLEVRDESDPPPADGKWLLKPRHGSGGRGIVIWDEGATDSLTLQEPHYFQQKASGTRVSAVFVGTEDPGSLRYVGLTRQLMGRPDLNAGPYNWCGSVGPIIMDPGGEILVRRTGAVLAHQFGLRGIFGCDFVMENATTPLLTEVNPRYTASVEVLEVLAETNLIHDHCQATGFEMPEGRDARVLAAPRGAVLGKLLLYADRDVIMPDISSWQLTGPFGPIPAYADVPASGTFTAEGSPVCTVLAAAADINQCIDYMHRRTTDVAAVLMDASSQE